MSYWKPNWQRVEEYIKTLKPKKGDDAGELIHEIDGMLCWLKDHYNFDGEWTWTMHTEMMYDRLIILIECRLERGLPQQRKYTINFI